MYYLKKSFVLDTLHKVLLGYGICGSYSGIMITVFVWEVMSHSLVDRCICARLHGIMS